MTEPTPSKSELRKFGFILAGLLLLFFGLVPYLKHHEISSLSSKIALAIALILAVLALIQPKALRPVMHFWTQLGHVMGAINTRIILGLFYFLVLAPMGLIGRISGKDKLGRKRGENLKSYRIVSRNADAKQMERIF